MYKPIRYHFVKAFTSKQNQIRCCSGNDSESLRNRLSQAMAELNHQVAATKREKLIIKDEYKPRHGYSGYLKKSSWAPLKDKELETKTTLQSQEDNGLRLFRKNHCLLMGYSGDRYKGMQYNPGVPTIESELFDAMEKNKWVTKENKQNPHTIQFQRGSRTDSGVSAVRQVCSLWLPEELDIDALNNDLPNDIRVFGIQRVTTKFDSRFQCNARTYSYTLPSVSFAHYNDQCNMRDYRAPAERLQLAQSVLDTFCGQTNFHNFTVDKQHFDRSSTRNIEYIKCVEPFIRDGVEFTRIEIKGQSFMLHQIRKMMGFSLAVIRGIIPLSLLKESLTKTKFKVATAPGLGLVLERLHFDKYNRLYGHVHGELTFDKYEKEIEEFRGKFINPTIIRTEIEEESMVTWLEYLVNHNYEYVPDEEINDELDDSWGEDPELWKKVEERVK